MMNEIKRVVYKIMKKREIQREGRFYNINNNEK